MKKYLVLLIALSACFASCVSEKDEVNPGGFVDVIFDLGVENAPETRAISDGTGATQLMWAIFNEGGEVGDAAEDFIFGLRHRVFKRRQVATVEHNRCVARIGESKVVQELLHVMGRRRCIGA